MSDDFNEKLTLRFQWPLRSPIYHDLERHKCTVSQNNHLSSLSKLLSFMSGLKGKRDFTKKVFMGRFEQYTYRVCSFALEKQILTTKHNITCFIKVNTCRIQLKGRGPFNYRTQHTTHMVISSKYPSILLIYLMLDNMVAYFYPTVCKVNYVNMQHIYVHIWLLYAHM